jgi:hypothetical protein
MFNVQVPQGSGPGSVIQAKSPAGNMVQVTIPAGVQAGATIQVIDPSAPSANVVGAPTQMTMAAPGGDIFRGVSDIFIKQEMAAVELCGVEAKQRYRISVPDGNREGSVFLFISEESECMERVCCGPSRALKLKLHAGPNKEAPVVMEMAKPFSCQVGCCLRPSFQVVANGQTIGHIEDPCRWCVMDQQVYEGTSENMLFRTEGHLCQAGMLCPCCNSVNFNVSKGNQQVALIEKMSLDMEELCLNTNRFMVHFDKIVDNTEKKLLLASAMLLDLQYFEKKK